MTVILRQSRRIELPIEADVITPDQFAGLSLEEIKKLEVIQGNQRVQLHEFFEVTGEAGTIADETDIVISGDTEKIKMIGKGMRGGRITVNGDAGMYLGAEMLAGRIHVIGSVDAWAGAEMRGGNIQIEGDAGNYLCAGYRGSIDGMQGGRVYVRGNVGREMAAHMRRGLIVVKGSVGDYAATRMKGGTIIIIGDVHNRLGLESNAGMILLLGRIERLLPTYRFSGIAEREFIGYYLRYITSRRPDFLSMSIDWTEKWIKFMGDFSEGRPNLEIYARYSTNQHLIPSNGDL